MPESPESPAQQLDAAPDVSNFGRLKGQLQPDTLALALLDAFRNGPRDQTKTRMLAAVMEHTSKKQTQDEAPYPKD